MCRFWSKGESDKSLADSTKPSWGIHKKLHVLLNKNAAEAELWSTKTLCVKRFLSTVDSFWVIGKDLCDPSDSLGPPLPEQKSLAHPDVLWSPQKPGGEMFFHPTEGEAHLSCLISPEYHGCVIVAPDSLTWVNSLDHGGLADIAKVKGGAEAAVDLCRMEQHAHLGLEVPEAGKLKLAMAVRFGCLKDLLL